MSKSLVIVESPAKAKTIKKYLGKDFSVEASSGHLIDLPNNKLGVNIEKNFKPEYVVIKNKKKFLDQLEKASKKADNIYLASDPDREGEAIAWHIVDRLKIKDKAYRVLIYEITEKAVLEAIRNPSRLSRDMFEAQQARRILDRLVGYQVSPLLWKKVRRGLSAGRVQSVALRLVVEREREVENFKPDEYWTIEAELKQLLDDAISFVAVLSKYDGEKVDIKTEEAANRAVEGLRNETYNVISVEKKERSRSAPPPFITSTLQQEASRKLRFPVKKTMTIAQKLYEGVELGDEGPAGLITYMRTDSVRVSEHAINEARGYIGEAYGADFLPEGPNIFKVKKSAQDAHEAIRPTSVIKSPDSVKIYLSEDEFELYKLIWQRFISCQMNPALYDQTTVEIEAGKGLFRATGSVIKFPGFTIVYMEGKEEEEEAKEKEEEKRLPDLSEGEDLKLIALEGKQHFTQPPPRFTESALVKELEERGIGRPSTYATILSTIQDREYVIKEKNRLKPTLLGCAITDLLIDGFPEVMDVQFTAEMEEKLDEVEEGSVNWVELLNGFYKGFGKRLEQAEVSMRSLRREGMPTELDCEQCGGQMIIKWGKRGEFLSCSKYPECKNAKQFEYGEDGEIRIKEKKEPEIRHDILCDLCGKPMVVRKSRYGKFLGCTSYPECKGIKRLKDVQGEEVDKVKESGESTEENKKESKRKSFRKSPAKKKAEVKSQAKGYQA
ncbi:MAG: putative DNA protecting protein DprA/DNA topoisomerase I, DNA topoisomerase I [Candidatus Dadabacteria bacterium CSP1-2]|nr:MAG: putative DNA protecting protein DprA/DNA topoisomerase I, DNA topoisomerase I [Candidatus Dadabacteria bacterium CSP1-2]